MDNFKFIVACGSSLPNALQILKQSILAECKADSWVMMHLSIMPEMRMETGKFALGGGQPQYVVNAVATMLDTDKSNIQDEKENSVAVFSGLNSDIVGQRLSVEK